MISLTIWFCLWSSFVVVAPPTLHINQTYSLEKITNLSNHSTKILIRQQKLNTNQTMTTLMNLHLFDITTYRSSWKFVDKNTIRVRFRLHEVLLSTVTVTRFLVRHIHSGHIQIYEKPHELINSTFTLYLHSIKHGRHTVCLLLHTLKFVKTPKYTFCQDIIFNFQKYGHHDIDSDEYGNTFVFLLTQYSIVIGILCLLQLVHAGRKRRFLKTVYNKANALRNVMMEYHRRLPDTKLSTDTENTRTNALECLIYNLNRNALYNFDQIYMPTMTEEDDENTINDSLPSINHPRTRYEKHLTLPNRFDGHSRSSLHRRSVINTTKNVDFDNENSDESDSDTRSYAQQSTSLKSLSHILEANKPWTARLTDDGRIKHSVLPLQESTRLQTNI
ncbi:hypothetical protein I4U23_028476 [Adineta vaga]|nr:hypothetical protein I4U23_028476 [Adineta vaga]